MLVGNNAICEAHSNGYVHLEVAARPSTVCSTKVLNQPLASGLRPGKGCTGSASSSHSSGIIMTAVCKLCHTPVSAQDALAIPKEQFNVHCNVMQCVYTHALIVSCLWFNLRVGCRYGAQQMRLDLRSAACCLASQYRTSGGVHDPVLSTLISKVVQSAHPRNDMECCEQHAGYYLSKDVQHQDGMFGGVTSRVTCSYI